MPYATSLIVLLLAALTAVPAPAAQPARGWSFAVVSDPHGAGSGWRAALEEMRDARANPPPPFSPVELVAVALEHTAHLLDDYAVLPVELLPARRQAASRVGAWAGVLGTVAGAVALA